MQPLVTESAIRAAVVEKARGEVGKHYGLVSGVPNPTPYGKWYGPGWERALFCMAGWSWCWDKALGTIDARNIIGYQTHGGTAPNGRGYVWTVAFWTQMSGRRVALRNLKPGDAVLYKYPTSGTRNTNPVNHVDIVEVNNPAGGYVDCIGFNVPKPGAPAGTDQSRGGGVWRRRTYYGNPYVVGGISINAAWLANRASVEWGRIKTYLTELGLANLSDSNVVGPATTAGIQAYAKEYGYTGHVYDRNSLLAHLEVTMSKILDALAKVNANVVALRKEVAEVSDRTTAEAISNAVWHTKHTNHGPFNAWWWLRRGLILNPEHKNFPADPGSPADVERKSQALILNEDIPPYTGGNK